MPSDHLSLRTFHDFFFDFDFSNDNNNPSSSQQTSSPTNYNSNNLSVMERLVFFMIPVGLLILVQILYWKKFQTLSEVYDIIPIGEKWLTNIIKVLVMLAIFICGIEAIVENSWTIRAWIFFAITVSFYTLWIFAFQFDNLLALDLSLFFMIIACISSQWLWIELDAMIIETEAHSNWKHVSKNVISFVVAIFILTGVINLGQILIYQCKMSLRTQAMLFWISSPIIFIALILWNSLSHPPFLDNLGMILAMILGFANSFISTLKVKEKEQAYEKLFK